MKTVLIVVGILLVLAGGIWVLQGVNILPGSYMSGNPQWAINGTISIIVGAGLVVWARRR